MTSAQDLDHLLYVESLHAAHFDEWERKSRDPLARMVFRLAADKERNHHRWVQLLVEMKRRGEEGGPIGVASEDLRFWVEDEGGEGASYERMAAAAGEPWVKAVLEQIAEDERTNARMLGSLLRGMRETARASPIRRPAGLPAHS